MTNEATETNAERATREEEERDAARRREFFPDGLKKASDDAKLITHALMRIAKRLDDAIDLLEVVDDHVHGLEEAFGIVHDAAALG